MSDEQFLTQMELSERWKLSVATLERDRMHKRGCPYHKFGGSVRYRLSDILVYESQCKEEMK